MLRCWPVAYFSDLTPYCYFKDMPAAKNIGWLQRGYGFDTIAPSEETLDLLWRFCQVPIMQTRGSHQCDLCATPSTVTAVRNGVELLLGSAEIRVFSKESNTSVLRRELGQKESSGLFFFGKSPVTGSVFAAPSLIYHYVETHHYKPRDEFLHAMKEGPKPPDPEYFEHLRKLSLKWTQRS